MRIIIIIVLLLFKRDIPPIRKIIRKSPGIVYSITVAVNIFLLARVYDRPARE